MLFPVFVTRTHILQSGLMLKRNRGWKNCFEVLKNAVISERFRPKKR